ncbi:hypothetical protein EVAR_41948_1 [Eumeta japonica]|uniref:Uncharacterized protein n=1 Tax=Eumeta variegata TaxID=151549 RepID=A0A4C1XJR8_EUMVA|nr:hypothetical protein EVAR_41948_1 [Eumeta japonica]
MTVGGDAVANSRKARFAKDVAVVTSEAGLRSGPSALAIIDPGCNTQFGRLTNFKKWDELTGLLNASGCECIKTMEKWKKVWVDWKNKTKKKAASIRTEISCGGGASRKLILSEQEQRLLSIIGKSAVMGRGPEIGFQNVIVPVEQEALNQSQLSRTPAPAIPAASRILSTRPNTEDEEDAEPPRTAGRASTHRVDRRRRRRPTPFQMASVQFAEIEQRRLDLKERRLEVDRLREENIAQNRQLQEKFLQDVVGTVLIERSSGGQHLAAFQAFEDSTDSRH